MTGLKSAFRKTRFCPLQPFAVGNANQIARVHTRGIPCLRDGLIFSSPYGFIFS